jgi:hypothetical protein
LKLVDIKVDPASYEDEVTSASGDWFTYVLLAYGIFAIADSIFHFISNDRTYVEMLKDAVTGVSTGG